MHYIALQMLFGDRGKYLAMVISITFAALIMTQQPSIFFGLMSRTYSFLSDTSGPDIWVMDPGVKFVEEHKPMRDTELGRVRGIPGVKWAAPMYKALLTAKLPDGQTATINMTGIDDATMIGAPPEVIEGSLYDLRKADSVIIGKEASINRLSIKLPDGSTRPLGIGDVIEINDKRAVVSAIAKVSRDFTLQAQVYTTYSRAIGFAAANRRKLTYVLVKAKEGVDHHELAARIEHMTGLKAMTGKDFQDKTYNYWMDNTGIPINFGMSTLFGVIIGIIVTGQSFYNFVRENLTQYAAIKAMGLTSERLVGMVLLQALIVGLIGYGLGVGLATVFGLNFVDATLAFLMEPKILLFSGVGVFLIVSVTAVIAIRQVIKVDPAVVFRG